MKFYPSGDWLLNIKSKSVSSLWTTNNVRSTDKAHAHTHTHTHTHTHSVQTLFWRGTTEEVSVWLAAVTLLCEANSCHLVQRTEFPCCHGNMAAVFSLTWHVFIFTIIFFKYNNFKAAEQNCCIFHLETRVTPAWHQTTSSVSTFQPKICTRSHGKDDRWRPTGSSMLHRHKSLSTEKQPPVWWRSLFNPPSLP